MIELKDVLIGSRIGQFKSHLTTYFKAPQLITSTTLSDNHTVACRLVLRAAMVIMSAQCSRLSYPVAYSSGLAVGFVMARVQLGSLEAHMKRACSLSIPTSPEPKSDMPLSSNDPRIRLNKTSFVVYNHVDLSSATRFLTDFGMDVIHRTADGKELFFGGYGSDPFVYVARQTDDRLPSFGGAAYLVEDREELVKAARVPGASPIRDLDAPGGGEIVTLHDPAGHPVHLVHGQRQKTIENLELRQRKLEMNYEDDKPRKGRFHRFQPGPAPVYKWGHYGVTYPDGGYQVMYDWYTTTLALAPSDVVYEGDKPITVFFHIDRGEDFTDHHAFFFKRTKPGLKPHVAHSAFEIHDFDVQQMGHDHLMSSGYNICWGVGRHVLGSQVFDYWFDPSNFIVEHYADGDLVNEHTPVSHEQAGPHTLAVWGPPVPEVF